MKTLYELMDMRGRLSFITGGVGYLGKIMSETLAELGSDLILLDLNNELLDAEKNRLESNYGIKVTTIQFNLENTSEINSVVEKHLKNINKVDVLINNAAFVGTSDIQGWVTDFKNQSVDTWRRALEVNLTSAFALSQSLSDLLKNSHNGSIINISSIYGEYGPDLSLYSDTHMGNPAAYSVSKGGLNQLTRWLSTVLAPNVRVNTISPGGIYRNQPEVFCERYRERTPLGRMATEEDFKGTIAYLASDMSKYVTGQNVYVDGGWGVW